MARPPACAFGVANMPPIVLRVIGGEDDALCPSAQFVSIRTGQELGERVCV
jgi:hypothetical protein